jgi:hypothetical protein
MAEKYVYAQGFYAGIACLMGQFTLSHGIRPSSATLYFPRNQSVPPTGDLLITGVDEFGGSAEITFHTCFADNVQATAGGDPLLVVRILDRRWAWEFGAISGSYNIRSESGDSLYNEKTPRELASLCLDVMGESNANLGDFNPTARPPITWELANPARALDELVNQFGYRIILGIDNRVHIERAGVGNISFLNAFTWLEDTVGVDLPRRPDGIIAACGRTLYNMDLYLEPVGLELNGEWKNIDKLSYRPNSNFVGNIDKGGWSSISLAHVPTNLNYPAKATTKDKEQINNLVIKHIFRTYRVCVRKPPHWMEDSIPNNPPYGDYLEIAGYTGEKVKERWQILPLEHTQNLRDNVALVPGEKAGKTLLPKRVNPEVIGTFNSGNIVAKDKAEREELRKKDDGYERAYKFPFDIDFENGLVHFEHHAHCIIDNVKKPARLKLRIASGIRDPKTREWKRHTLEHQFGQPLGAGSLILAHEEIQLRYAIDPNTPLSPPKNNKQDVERELRYYLNAAIASLEQRAARSGTFAGIVAIAPSGLVQQVTWNFGSGPTTQFSANTEHNYNVPNYQERRLLAKLQDDKRKGENPRGGTHPSPGEGAPT